METSKLIAGLETEIINTTVVYINYSGNDWIEGSYFAFDKVSKKLYLKNFISSKYIDKNISFLEGVDTIEVVIQKLTEYSSTNTIEIVKEFNRKYKKVFTKNYGK